MKEYCHIPVLKKEVIAILAPSKAKIILDGTVGMGGHARMFLEKGARVIALDRDREAIVRAKKNLENYQASQPAAGENIEFYQENFANLNKILKTKVDGVLLDLGMSSMQLEDRKRGFSFEEEAPLNMQMDQDQDLTAEEIINTYPEEKLAKIFFEYGEERYARKIARAIVRERQKRLIKTTSQLVEIIKKSIPFKYRIAKKKHFATNIFRALRMEVNHEVENLIQFLSIVCKYVKKGGKIVIISFHSIEDRIVKRGFKKLKLEGSAEIITKKPIIPQEAEIKNNPRARSAKLRAIKVI